MTREEYSKRWQEFSAAVKAHIEQYTVPQYGDWPHDQLTMFRDEDVRTNIRRYENRMGSNSRGLRESLRDCLKMAHYHQILFWGHGPRASTWQMFSDAYSDGLSRLEMENIENTAFYAVCNRWHMLREEESKEACPICQKPLGDLAQTVPVGPLGDVFPRETLVHEICLESLSAYLKNIQEGKQ